MKNKLFIDAPKEYFCNWLQDFTSDAPYRFFPTEKGKICLQRASYQYSHNKEITFMGMDCLYVIEESNKPAKAYNGGFCIEFKIIPLTPTRIEIGARCNQPATMEYYAFLLSEIIKRWPQSDEIKNEIFSLRKKIEEEFSNTHNQNENISAQINNLDEKLENEILETIKLGRIEQFEIQKMVDAIRRTLKYIIENGIKIDAPQITSLLQEIYSSINSSIDLEEQIELSIPIIPLLLSYKLDIGASVDLSAAWKEFLDRVKQMKNEN